MHSRWSPPNRVGAASLAMLILTLGGCATHAQSGAGVKTDIQDLQNRIYELQKRNAEAQVEIQDLRDKEARGGASGPSSPASLSQGGQVTSEEALVPGSTEDLGEEGPSRSMEPAGPSGKPASPSEGAPSGTPGATGGSEADKLYVDGYARFNTGDYAKAKDEFSEFLARSPESDLADDAQYWIGECYFSQKDYRRAILEFRKVIDQYPFGNRVPHAFLKVGLSYLALGDRERASESLETVVQAFPKSEVATVAQGTLDEIKKSPSH
jgi:tol-pal system protein YbgF